MASVRTTSDPRQHGPRPRERSPRGAAPSAEALRREVAAATPRDRKRALGQFMTPEPVARFMASMFRRARPGPLSLLDAGAGFGALAAAALDRWRRGELGTGPMRVVAHELDERLRPHLEGVLARYRADGAEVRVLGGDYLAQAAAAIEAGRRELTHAILNPPYKKIAAASDARLQCRRAGLETVNLYAAFVGLALAQLRPGGQLVAIVPRSFCNGPYYRPFRRFVLERAAIRRIHLFEARDHAFGDDDVLQENVIVLLERDAGQAPVTITTSRDARFEDLAEREVPFAEIVSPGDAELFIRVPTTGERDPLATAPGVRYKLADLGLAVSTGPVVDFRLREHLAPMPARGTVPLLYPAHVSGRDPAWPLEGGKKPNAIARNADTERWLFPAGVYTVVRRFSSKEARRRVVASVVAPDALPGAAAIGFENHLNVFHANRAGLAPEIAWGLFAYLSCTAVDDHVRRFNGHTQVNATDLRALPYPSPGALGELGRWAARTPDLDQREIDRRVRRLVAR
ncbi:MAG TPA: Eco57I restriction-modification methylase domain-containing protein [Kofleriaceae bacterium]|nr:Eco57I restriction-modification methylase domain-containing protein [Kofleriaceae bacterium]